MTLKDQLNADLRDAMRSGEETRKTTLRLLLTAIRNAEIPAEGSSATQRGDLDDANVRLGDAGDEPQQSAFARAIQPHHSKSLTRA